MGPVIYTPKARAAEYAPLACNLYEGCVHGCEYCYAPRVVHKERSVFHAVNRPRKDIIKRLELDLHRRMFSMDTEVLLCFTCDPYQVWPEPSCDVTRHALEILMAYGQKTTILTKGGMRATRDFDILKRNNWSFGTTLCFLDEKLREHWEPNAASIQARTDAIRIAHGMGIRTWVSVEPVIYCEEALKVISRVMPWVDHFKVGKINYHKYIEDREDWPQFLEDVERRLRGHSYYIKQDLLRAAGRGCS